MGYVLWLEGFTKIRREAAKVQVPVWCPLGREETRATPPSPRHRQAPRLLVSQPRGGETLGPSQHLFHGQLDPESSALQRGAASQPHSFRSWRILLRMCVNK